MWRCRTRPSTSLAGKTAAVSKTLLWRCSARLVRQSAMARVNSLGATTGTAGDLSAATEAAAAVVDDASEGKEGANDMAVDEEQH